MAALNLLGRSGALRLLWVMRDGPRRFRDLTAGAELSPSVLNARLKELRAARLIDVTDQGYALTRHGLELGHAMESLHEWSKAWARALR